MVGSSRPSCATPIPPTSGRSNVAARLHRNPSSPACLHGSAPLRTSSTSNVQRRARGNAIKGFLPGSSVEFWAAGVGTWLPASVRRHDQGLEIYELGVSVNEDRVRRMVPAEEQEHPPSIGYSRPWRDAPVARQPLADLASHFDELLGRMQQTAGNLEDTSLLVDCLKDFQEYGQRNDRPARPKFRMAEDVEYCTDGHDAWLPAVLRACHAAGDQSKGICELSVSAAENDVRQAMSETSSSQRCIHGSADNYHQNLDLLRSGTCQLEQHLATASERLEEFAGKCGVEHGTLHKRRARPSSATLGSRPTSRPALRPSSAKRWSIRQGQFGLVKTAWHGSTELG